MLSFNFIDKTWTWECRSEGQKNGIWAWDCLSSRVVLLIPSILALLGDNPMQSELSCHVGLNGNLFCRICTVKGSDTSGDPAAQLMERTMGFASNSTPPAGTARMTVDDSDCASVASSTGSNAGQPKRKKKETMLELANRAKEFLKVYFCLLVSHFWLATTFRRFRLFGIRWTRQKHYIQYSSMCARWASWRRRKN